MATIEARELEIGHGVKALGAPAFSTIRDVAHEDDLVRARLDWGEIHYEPNEQVEVGRNCPSCGGTKQISFVRDERWHVQDCEACA